VSHTLESLKRLTRRRWLRQWLLVTVLSGLGLGVTLGLLALLDLVLPLQERHGFIAISTLVVFGGCGFVAGMLRLRRYRMTEAKLAELIEKARPELMDTLNTSVAILRKPEAERSLLERKVLEEALQKTAGLDLPKIVFPKILRAGSLLLLILLCAALFCVDHFSSVGYKFRNYLGDLVHGEFSGMSVVPGSLEAPRGKDFTLEVQLHRGEPKLEIEYLENGDWVRYPLNSEGDDRFSFRFYDLQDDFRFRLHSPSLRSPWYQVVTYEPPEIDTAQVAVLPPAYSGFEPEVIDRLSDIEALAGSELHFLVEGESLKDLTIELEDSQVELVADQSGAFAFTMRAEESLKFRWIMQSPTGHRAQTDTFELTVIPDEAPVLEWLEPGEDVAAFPDEAVPLKLYAGDDFGLKTVLLNISVSGRKQESMLLHQRAEDAVPGLEELTLMESLDLPSLGAMDGDVVSYSATAMDIREPEPRIVRSEVFFVEVRVTKEAIELESQNGMEGEMEKLDVRALVIALKQIIRESYIAVGLPADEQVLKNQEIGAALGMLRKTIEDIMVNAAPVLTQQGQEHLMEFLIRAREHMEKAETMINSNAPNLATSEEEQALSELVSFESELARNMMNSQSSSGGEGQPNEPPPNEVASDSEQGQQPPEPQFNDLPEALEDLNALIDRQNALNESMAKASRRDAASRDLSEMQDEQESLATDTVEMRDRLERLMPGHSSGTFADAAAEQMGVAGESLESGDAGAGMRAGERARENLMAAATVLEEGINQVADAMLEQLQQGGQQLAQRQGQEGQSSQQAADGKLSSEERSALPDQQRELNDAVQEWMDQLNETANQLRGQFPETARALDELAEGAEDENLEGEGTRAANALRYRRYERAGEIQDELQGMLESLSEGVGEAQGSMSSLANAALRNALDQLQQARQELEGMRQEGQGQSPGEGESTEGNPDSLSSVQQSMSQMLSDLGEMLGDDQLREMSGMLMQEREGQAWDGQLRGTEALLGQAEQLIRDRLSQAMTELQLDLMRQSSEPPEKYRSQVEKYFESLSKERPGGSR